jgi:hypothetical protein
MVFDFTIVQFGEIILSYLIFERLNNHLSKLSAIIYQNKLRKASL